VEERRRQRCEKGMAKEGNTINKINRGEKGGEKEKRKREEKRIGT